MTDTPDIAELARKLTKAQRDAICALPLLVDGRRLAQPKTRTVCGVLRSAGLTAVYSAAYDKLTPLGLAVRNHLLQDHDQ